MAPNITMSLFPVNIYLYLFINGGDMKTTRIRNFAVIIWVAMILIPNGATFAEEQEKKWEDSAELSYVQTGGNTDVMTFSGNNTLKYNFSEKWASTWKLGALYGETDGENNAERYYTDIQTDYNASDTLFYYLKAGWLKDKFAGIDSRVYLGPGAGYKFLKGDRQFLSAEAGLNYATESYTDDTDSDFLEGRVLGKYEFVFNSKTKFTQTAEYLHNFDNSEKYRINTLTGLVTQLTDMFSLKISYEIKFQNEPSPETLDQTDTLFSVALVVNF